MEKRRVVITGAGLTSSLGLDTGIFFDRLESGDSAVRLMTEWSEKLKINRIAAPVTLPEGLEKSIPRIFRRSMGRMSIYSALAAEKALQTAGLSREFAASGRCACVIGSTMGSSESIMEASRLVILNDSENMPALQFFKCASHSAAFNTANFLGLTGSVLAPASACASGLQAIGLGRDLILSGAQDAAICGGAEEVTPEVTASFELMFAAAKGFSGPPRYSSRPFAADRVGLVCGEGAGLVVLEEYEHAVKRSANILCEIIGYATCSCGSHVSQSDHRSIIRCMDLAFHDAAISPEQSDYISAHATATIHGDAEEAMAIREFFGSKTPVSSLKGHLGHTLGASGAIELIASMEMMKRGRILPTLNLEQVAADCAGLDHVRTVREQKINIFVKNCFAFGGINATLICRKI
ncbi:MAG: beta-ketoacyl-[acyl-carrier-protein] synthase family protein [Lentisphaerota bacterium]